MRPLLRRIAINGGLTAIALGIVGLMLAELATMWLTATFSKRPSGNEPIPVTSAMKSRLPILMALSGFAIVAVGEAALHYWRRNRRLIPPAQEEVMTEKRLQELLAQADAQSPNPPDAVAPNPPASENRTEPKPAAHSAGGKT